MKEVVLLFQFDTKTFTDKVTDDFRYGETATAQTENVTSKRGKPVS